MEKHLSIRQILISLLLMVVFVSGMVAVYFYYQKHNAAFSFAYSKAGMKKEKGHNKMTVKLNMGVEGRLGMVLAVPYEKSGQANELWNKYPKIINDFNLYVPPDELEDLVENREYEAIRMKTLEIINSNLNKPVETVYFDSFFYE